MNQRTMMTKIKATVNPNPVFGHWDILLGIYWPMASGRDYFLIHLFFTPTSPFKQLKRNKSGIPQDKANRQTLAGPKTMLFCGKAIYLARGKGSFEV
jgi:hypothetical protein